MGRATLLRIVVELLLIFTFFATALGAGEAMSDPGGWAGAGLAASWVVPKLGMMTLAWFRPMLPKVLCLFSRRLWPWACLLHFVR